MSKIKISEEIVKIEYPRNYPTPPDALSEGKLSRILEMELKEWKVVRSPLPTNPFITREELYRAYSFENFEDVIEFINKVAVACNIFPHHPRWENSWKSLQVYLSTWDSKHIITYKDIMMARVMDKTFKEYDKKSMDLVASGMKDMETTSFVDQVRQLIIDDRYEEVFISLNQFIALNPELKDKDELVSVLSEFNRFQRKKRNNDLSDAEESKMIRSIRQNLLEIIKSLDYDPSIFFSYAWGGEKEKFIDELYDSLKQDGYKVVRDKVDHGYKGIISDFMEGMGKGRFVIIAISDKYLKSEYCMFELYEIFRNAKMDKKELLKKIYPVRVENIDLRKANIIKKYLDYWHKLEKEWEVLVTSAASIISPEQHLRYSRIKKIATDMGSLMDFLSDINSLSKEQLSKDNFAEIKVAMQKMMKAPR